MTGSAEEIRARILEDVRRMLAEVIGEEYMLDLEVEMTSSFEDDLEIESVEFVALAERLTEFYGERVDFVEWLADKELEDIVGLRVGDLVEFIAECLS